MSEIIRTGIASFGMSGKVFHAPFIQQHPGFELVAIVERHKSESRERYPETRLIRSFEELVDDPTLDLIVVNTPVQTHFEYVKLALEGGKHVVVEKPFTVNAAEAQELDELATSLGLLLSVYQNRRYDGDYHALKKVIDDGLLGDIREVEIRYDRYRPGFSGKEHKEGNIPGAGVLHDLGAHMIDQSLQLFGWPQKVFADLRVVRVAADARNEHGGGADVGGIINGGANDYFEALLYYPALRVRIKSTVIARAAYPAFIVHGINGSYMQERSDQQEENLLKGAVPSVQPWCPSPASPDGFLHSTIDGKEVNQSFTSTSGNYMDYYDDIWKALNKQAPNPVPASDAVKTMRIIDAAVLSDQSGKVIELGPDQPVKK